MTGKRLNAAQLKLAKTLRDEMTRKLISISASDLTATWLSETSGIPHYTEDPRMAALDGIRVDWFVPSGCCQFRMYLQNIEKQSLPGVVYL